MYPAENVVSIEGEFGTFERKEGQPDAIEVDGDSIFEATSEE